MSPTRQHGFRFLYIKSIFAVIAVSAAAAIPITACDFYAASPLYQTTHPIESGNRYLQEMDYENAVTAFETAIRKDPLNTEAYLKLADTYAVLEKPEEAIRILQNGYIVTGEECLQTEAERLSEENDSQETVPETE